MRRTSLSLLILALLVGACGDDGGPKVYQPDELRLAVISGDAQTGQVASADDASLSVSAAASLQTVPPGLEVLDRPLVVQLVTESGQRVMGASIPPSMRAAWIVEDQGCGRPFHGDTDFDEDGRAENLWIRGTTAGVECTMYAGRIVGGQVVIDSVFTAEFEPGPVHWVTLSSSSGEVSTTLRPGETFDARPLVIRASDRHGNRLDAEAVRALPDTAISWRWYQHEGGATERHGTGWVVTMPDPVADGYRGVYNPPNRYSPGFTRFRAMFRLTINGGPESQAVEFTYSIPDS